LDDSNQLRTVQFSGALSFFTGNKNIKHPEILHHLQNGLRMHMANGMCQNSACNSDCNKFQYYLILGTPLTSQKNSLPCAPHQGEIRILQFASLPWLDGWTSSDHSA
jgi:hypothetical protein